MFFFSVTCKLDLSRAVSMLNLYCFRKAFIRSLNFFILELSNFINQSNSQESSRSWAFHCGWFLPSSSGRFLDGIQGTKLECICQTAVCWTSLRLLCQGLNRGWLHQWSHIECFPQLPYGAPLMHCICPPLSLPSIFLSRFHFELGYYWRLCSFVVDL